MKRSLNSQAGRSNEELEHRSSLLRARWLHSAASRPGPPAPAPVVPLRLAPVLAASFSYDFLLH